MRYHGVLFGLFTLALTGCNTYLKEQQLQGVAKDWCLSIRACQVLPVYPLTEDVQPGDVFLVHMTADQEVQAYTTNGFLPLSGLVARIPPTNYHEFYSGGYGVAGPNVSPPRQWQFPTSNPSAQPDYRSAPRAEFPAFSFSIKHGEGLNASFPIHAIPVGLGLLDSGDASGTLAFGEAYTFGSDMKTIEEGVRDWATQPKNTAFLKRLVQRPAISRKDHPLLAPLAAIEAQENPTYLRVVTRVYLVGQVNVTLTDENSSAATASGGVPKPVDLSNMDSRNTVQNYAALNSLLQSANGGLPGGTVKLALATARSVSLVDRFDRPLVLGYLAIDLEVLPDGTLGPPIPTLKKVAVLVDQLKAKKL
jgi:hypothetical protein